MRAEILVYKHTSKTTPPENAHLIRIQSSQELIGFDLSLEPSSERTFPFQRPQVNCRCGRPIYTMHPSKGAGPRISPKFSPAHQPRTQPCHDFYRKLLLGLPRYFAWDMSFCNHSLHRPNPLKEVERFQRTLCAKPSCLTVSQSCSSLRPRLA